MKLTIYLLEIIKLKNHVFLAHIPSINWLKFNKILKGVVFYFTLLSNFCLTNISSFSKFFNYVNLTVCVLAFVANFTHMVSKYLECGMFCTYFSIEPSFRFLFFFQFSFLISVLTLQTQYIQCYRPRMKQWICSYKNFNFNLNKKCNQSHAINKRTKF